MPTSTKLRILMVLTSQDRFGGQGTAARRKTGFWFEGFAAPYFLLRDAGAELTLASPRGGKPPIDPDSRKLDSHSARRFATDDCGRAALAETLILQDVYAVDFDGAFYCSGFGCYWDLATDPVSADLIASLLAIGRPVALVAEAAAALLPVLSSPGRPLVAGRQVTGYSDKAAAGVAGALPFSLEEALALNGAAYRHGPEPDRHVLQDGMLITGETTAASEAVARVLLDSITRSTQP